MTVPDPTTPPGEIQLADQVELAGLSETELYWLSDQRRLKLDRSAMRAIQEYFSSKGRPATAA